MGYATGVGETWNKGYRVIPLESLRDMDLSVTTRPESCKVHVQVVAEVTPVVESGNREVVFGKWRFPCREVYDKLNESVDKAELTLGKAMDESAAATAGSVEGQGDGADVPRHCGQEHVQGSAANGGARGSDQPEGASEVVLDDGTHQEVGNAEDSVQAEEVQASAANGGAGIALAEPDQNVVKSDTDVAEVISYAPSGHKLRKDKDYWRVSPCPPSVSTKQWVNAGYKKGRLKLLNEYRRPKNLRLTDNWDEMMVFLMEEHAPFLAGTDHVFPWGGPVGPSNPGPSAPPQPVVKAVIDAGGAQGRGGNVPALPEPDDTAFQVKLLSSRAFVPMRGTAESAGLDLCATERVVIQRWKQSVVGTGLAFHLPKGTYGRIAPRSGLALKHGLHVGAGVVDRDYRGEVKVLLINLGDEDYVVNPGERIAQLVLERVHITTPLVVRELGETNRGQSGFGSTGVQAYPGADSEKAGGEIRHDVAASSADFVGADVGIVDKSFSEPNADGGAAGAANGGASCYFATAKSKKSAGTFHVIGNEVRYSPPSDYKDMKGIPKTMEAAYATLQDLSTCKQREKLARMLFCDLEEQGYGRRYAVLPWLMEKTTPKLLRLRCSAKALTKECNRILRWVQAENDIASSPPQVAENTSGQAKAITKVPAMPVLEESAEQGAVAAITSATAMMMFATCSEDEKRSTLKSILQASEAVSNQNVSSEGMPKINEEQIWVRVPASMFPGDSAAKDMKDPVIPFVPESRRPANGGALEESFPVCFVARAVPKKEVREVEAADKACKAEWHRLELKGCWDVKGVRPWREVKAEANRKGEVIHVGALHELCFEKGSELEVGDPNRKYKGRVVFLGDRVRDQSGQAAVFEELSSSPAALEAGKLCDLYGSMMRQVQSAADGGAGQANKAKSGRSANGGAEAVKSERFVLQTSDALQAYCQAKLKGNQTWIRIPEHRWPPGWEKVKDPVVPLVLALYGHPSSGAYWEERCDTKVRSCGFVGIGDCGEWRSCYYHPELDVLLIVYVDDFKMAGPESAVTKAWSMIRSGDDKLEMEDPVTLESYLGCAHELSTHTTKDGVQVRAVKYNMEGQFVQGLKKYKELAGIQGKLPKVDTPFLAEDSGNNAARSPIAYGEGWLCPWCKGCFAAQQFKRCHDGKPVSVANGDAGVKGKQGTSATDGGAESNGEASQPGVLADTAAKVVMKVLYAARYARFELLRAIGFLACHVSKWDVQCDRRLYRLMSYIEHTLDHRLCGWTDGVAENVHLHLYSDADFGGCNDTNKSTTGVYIAAEGSHTRWPISGLSKKQSCVSHSTPEAELVAGAFALRQEGIPVQMFFDATVGMLSSSTNGGALEDRKTLYFHADNTAMITCCKSGKNQTMRHMGRTHGISLQWMHDEIRKGYCELRYIDTAKMAADVFTKFFPQAKANVWTEVRKLVNVLSPQEFKDMVGMPGEGHVSVQESKSKGIINKSTTHGGANIEVEGNPRRCRRSARIGRKVSQVIYRAERRGVVTDEWTNMHEVFSEIGQAISAAVGSAGSSGSWDFKAPRGLFSVDSEDNDFHYAVINAGVSKVRLVRSSDGGGHSASEYDVSSRCLHRLRKGDVVSSSGSSGCIIVLRTRGDDDSFASCGRQGRQSAGGPPRVVRSSPSSVASMMRLTCAQKEGSCQSHLESGGAGTPNENIVDSGFPHADNNGETKVCSTQNAFTTAISAGQGSCVGASLPFNRCVSVNMSGSKATNKINFEVTKYDPWAAGVRSEVSTGHASAYTSMIRKLPPAQDRPSAMEEFALNDMFRVWELRESVSQKWHVVLGLLNQNNLTMEVVESRYVQLHQDFLNCTDRVKRSFGGEEQVQQVLSVLDKARRIAGDVVRGRPLGVSVEAMGSGHAGAPAASSNQPPPASQPPTTIQGLPKPVGGVLK